MTEFEKGVLAMFFHLANKLDDESLKAGHARIAQELIDRDKAKGLALNFEPASFYRMPQGWSIKEEGDL